LCKPDSIPHFPQLGQWRGRRLSFQIALDASKKPVAVQLGKWTLPGVNRDQLAPDLAREREGNHRPLDKAAGLDYNRHLA